MKQVFNLSCIKQSALAFRLNIIISLKKIFLSPKVF
jgi:hypothetical protein